MSKQQQGPGRDVNIMQHAEGRRAASLAFVLLLPFVLAVASRASAQDQFAVGGGKSFALDRDYVQFAFSAHKAPDGTTSGHITLNWPPASNQPKSDHGQILADVVCLEVNGSAATVYGLVTKSDNPDTQFNPPDWVGISVADEPDTFIGFFGLGDPPCIFVGFGGLFPLTDGNIEMQN